MQSRNRKRRKAELLCWTRMGQMSEGPTGMMQNLENKDLGTHLFIRFLSKWHKKETNSCALKGQKGVMKTKKLRLCMYTMT